MKLLTAIFSIAYHLKCVDGIFFLMYY